MQKSPCVNCMDRSISCHSICTKYKEWFNALKMEKAEILKSVELEKSLNRKLHKIYRT